MSYIGEPFFQWKLREVIVLVVLNLLVVVIIRGAKMIVVIVVVVVSFARVSRDNMQGQ